VSKLCAIDAEAMNTHQAYGPTRQKPLEVFVVLGLEAFLVERAHDMR
jgi:hypothetical protein